MNILFWTCLIIIFYTFVGYGILMYLLVKLKKSIRKKKEFTSLYLPTCTVVIAAYNEESYIRDKIVNTLALNYPTNQMTILVVADGSTDGTVDIIRKFPGVTLLYKEERQGKVHAINRAMEYVKTEIVVFTDANTYLNEDSLITICNHYRDPHVGGVAGEKRIFSGKRADASAAGEGLYWKYESTLKHLDSELNSAVGAAGELFSIRRSLYVPIPAYIILDDFVISMQIAQLGYRIIYEPEAYALESSSSSIQEELKRKIRIAAGGIQSIIYLKSLLNVSKHPLLSFQYISHRVLRWTITPFLIILLFGANVTLFMTQNELYYAIILYCQLGFYCLAFLGHLSAKQNIKLKIFFIPYYFCIMNYSIIAGIFKFAKKEQSAVWEKSERKLTSDLASLIEEEPV